AVYVGDPVGKAHLEASGFSLGALTGGVPPATGVLVVGPGGVQRLVGHDIGNWLRSGGRLLAIGLNKAEADSLLENRMQMKNADHIAAYFRPADKDTWLAGVAPADVHNRDPRELPLVTGGAEVVGDGVLAHAQGLDATFCQLVPWQFDAKKQMNLK